MNLEAARRRDRWKRSEEVRRINDRLTRYRAEQLKAQWIDYLSHPTVCDSLTHRVDLTLKQRRNSDLDTVRPSVERINVRVQPRRFRLQEASNFAVYHYLSNEETRKIAVRIANRVNTEIFGNRTRRSRKGRRVANPKRMTALICQHDQNTRQHLHCLFAKPSGVSEESFRHALHVAMSKEPFVNRILSIEEVQNLGRSILYNNDEAKSRTQSPILYVYPQVVTASPEGELHEETTVPYEHNLNSLITG